MKNTCFEDRGLKKIVTVEEMVHIERAADAAGHTYYQMMEHAGKGLAQAVHDAYSYIDKKGVLGLIGSGNNGGDTLVAFVYLQEWGWQTTAYIVRPRLVDDPLLDRARRSGCVIIEIDRDPSFEKLSEAIKTHTILLDGVLGTGIRLPLRGKIREVLDLVRERLAEVESPPYIVAVDCPSGVDCDTGEVAPESISGVFSAQFESIDLE